MGYSDAALDKPIVGICYTASGFNNCHRHFPELLEAVKRGVLAEGALPVPFPVISLGEVFLSPTSMLFRNLMAMDVEEMIRAQPMDSVVLMGGCDKTVPALLMGAASANKPAALLVGGPMMTGRHKGERLGACTDCRRFWARYRGGDVDAEEISLIEGRLAVTAGTCAVMGTASTMAILGEALGMMAPNSAAIPAVHADRLRAAEATGALAARLVGGDRTPQNVMTAAAFEKRPAPVLLAISRFDQRPHIDLTAIAGQGLTSKSISGKVQPGSRTKRLSWLTLPAGLARAIWRRFLLRRRVFLEGVLRALRPSLNLNTRDIGGQTLSERLAKPLLDEIDPGFIRTVDIPIDPQGG